MPSAVAVDNNQDLTEWVRPQKTVHELPWADIKVIDLGKYDRPGGKEELSEELRDAVSRAMNHKADY